MSVNLPPELAWVAKLAVGQSWPEGDEDKLMQLGDAWDQAAQQLVTISNSIDPATSGVLANLGGAVADQFQSFVTQLQGSMPDMSDAASQMGQLGRNTGVQIEYSKYMILAQLVWLAAELVQLAFWAPELAPAAITSARLVVQMILRRLITSVATGIGFMVGMDVAIQTIQFLKGDRTQWDVQDTISAVESGAISGAIGGVFSGVGEIVVPKFAGSLIGKAAIGGVTGVVSTAAMDGIFGGDGDYGSTLSSSIIGALAGGGGGRRRFGGDDDNEHIDVDVKLPTMPDLDLHLPGLGDGEKSLTDDFDTDTDFGTDSKSGTDSASDPDSASDSHSVSDGEVTTHSPVVTTESGDESTDSADAGRGSTAPAIRTESGGAPAVSPAESFATGQTGGTEGEVRTGGEGADQGETAPAPSEVRTTAGEQQTVGAGTGSDVPTPVRPTVTTSSTQEATGGPTTAPATVHEQTGATAGDESGSGAPAPVGSTVGAPSSHSGLTSL
jgi:hypothetical protein